jgi:pilus assembly protein CpaE
MTLYFEPDPARAGRIADVLGGSARNASDLTELARLVDTGHDQSLLVLGPGVPLAEALRVTAERRLSHPALGVVLLRDAVDVAVLGEAIRAGVREVVAADDTESIRAACARSLELSRGLSGAAATPGPGSTQGRMVTVFGGKGGVGKSTIATNLAVCLAAGGARRVLLVDLDLAFGDVAIMMQLVPKRSLSDAIPMAGRMDETGLRSMLTTYAPGLETLLAPTGPAEAERISRELTSEVLTVARQLFDYVVVDTPPFFNDHVLAALDLSDDYVLLATPDVPSLKNLRLTLDMFDLLEYQNEGRLVVLNRSDSRVGLTAADIDRVLRVPISGHVPSTRDVPVSINRGVPLMADSPDHPVSRSIRQVAEAHLGGRTVGASDADTKQSQRRLFSLRKGR